MVPRTAIPEWKLTAEKFGAARLAHGFGQIGAVEDEALRGEAVKAVLSWFQVWKPYG